jgi:hypothetical protein
MLSAAKSVLYTESCILRAISMAVPPLTMAPAMPAHIGCMRMMVDQTAWAAGRVATHVQVGICGHMGLVVRTDTRHSALMGIGGLGGELMLGRRHDLDQHQK